jgi:AcrR family transcriptional regulator
VSKPASRKKGQTNAALGEITRVQVMDAAERLFASHGPEAVSIRTIAAEAKVSLGAINYHFVSKEKLFEEVFRRRVIPLNEQRVEMLKRVTAAAGRGLPDLEDVIEAFVTPPLSLMSDSAGKGRALVVMQFLSHAFSIPGEDGFLESYYEPVRTLYIGTFRKLLPHLSTEDVLWRYNYMVGAIIYAMGGPTRMTRLPRALRGSERVRLGSANDAIRQLVKFCAAGFEAPSCVAASSSGARSTERKAGARSAR